MEHFAIRESLEHKIEHMASLLADVMRTSVTIEDTVSRRLATIVSGRSTPSTTTGNVHVSTSSGLGMSGTGSDEQIVTALSPTITGKLRGI